MNIKSLCLVGTIFVSVGVATEDYVSQFGSHIKIQPTMDNVNNIEEGDSSSKYQGINQPLKLPLFSENIIPNQQKQNLNENQNITNFPFQSPYTYNSFFQIPNNIPSNVSNNIPSNVSDNIAIEISKEVENIVSDSDPQLSKTEQKTVLKAPKTAKTKIKKVQKKTSNQKGTKKVQEKTKQKTNKNSFNTKTISNQQSRPSAQFSMQNPSDGSVPMAQFGPYLGTQPLICFIPNQSYLLPMLFGNQHLVPVIPVIPQLSTIDPKQASIPPFQNIDNIK
ncbi:MAG: hypothetical protein II670_09710 [Alphaproteobacteria bacterium]|nr:hypothetical protein [Alphaproteobacteria bacterium]